MLHFSRSKQLLILGACLLGILLALPNFFAPGALPAWLPQPRINLGLDLQGGSHLLLEVDMKTVLKERIGNLRTELRQALLKAQVPHRGIGVVDRGASIEFATESELGLARKALADILQARSEGMSNALIYDASVEGARLLLRLSGEALEDMAAKAVGQSVMIVRRRIDETGVNEPVVARQGRDRILVELPGVSDPDRVKRLLGSTAKMTFRLVAPFFAVLALVLFVAALLVFSVGAAYSEAGSVQVFIGLLFASLISIFIGGRCHLLFGCGGPSSN